jgi:cell division protein FtsQ
VAKLITGDRSVALVGNTYGRIDLKEIETRTETNTYIQEAEAYKDHRGDLIVDAYIARPIARIMQNGKPDLYITDKGNLVKTSTNYTSRVLLITGDYVKNFRQNLRQDSAQQVLFNFLEYIYNDDFWKAQIAQIDINSDGEMTIYPQVTKQYVQFGTLDEWPEKMEKLKIFYDKILPFKGWNAYTRVNLIYENQIICE